jgi:hypothetical protein
MAARRRCSVAGSSELAMSVRLRARPSFYTLLRTWCASKNGKRRSEAARPRARSHGGKKRGPWRWQCQPRALPGSASTMSGLVR